MSHRDEQEGAVHADSQSQREQEMNQVREALRGIRFGTVTLIIQDGVLVQIDRTEKRRIRRGGNAESKSS